MKIKKKKRQQKKGGHCRQFAAGWNGNFPFDFIKIKKGNKTAKKRLRKIPRRARQKQNKVHQRNGFDSLVQRTVRCCFGQHLPWSAKFIDFSRILLAFTGLYWVLPGFEQVLPRFHRISPSCIGLYRVLPGFTGFSVVITMFCRVSLGFTGFYWVLMGFIGF